MCDPSRCPDPEILSAFVAGTLSMKEKKTVTEHLPKCEDCRFIVREAAKQNLSDTHTRFAAAAPRGSLYPRWLVAAAVLVGFIGFAAWHAHTSQEDGIATLVEAMPRNGRYIEPRLGGGFPWAPWRSVPRSVTPVGDPEHMKFLGTAGVVLEKSAGDASPRSQHSVAVVQLLAGHPEEATRLLSGLAHSTPDADVWNDLAAAHYVKATKTGDAGELTEALAAADAALRIDPARPEALFNRSFIVERLGVRRVARLAWERYLRADLRGPWADEARQHLTVLSPERGFREELERHYSSLEDDPRLARSLAMRFPEEARIWGETEILGRWAEAAQKGDAAAAARHLGVARAFGDELAASHGETMLQGAVLAAERAEGLIRPVLAEAHIRFREAQRAFKAERPAEAQSKFEAATAGFERAASPLALLGRYFTANTLYEQGKIDEARTRLEALRLAAASFPACRAQIEWELGLVYASRGRWGDSIQTFKNSVATFEHLHEAHHAASVREFLAQVYDRIGDTRAAWQNRIAALQELGRFEDLRLEEAMFSAARAAAVRRHWDVSLALLDLQLEMDRPGGDDLLFVETLLLRAGVHAKLGRPREARADLTQVKGVMAGLSDAAPFERAQTEYQAVEARLIDSPWEAIARLTDVIAFHQSKGREMFLPELYLQRGRTNNTLGRTAAASADFEAGIVELEKERETLEPGEDRWGVFAAADDLVDEAVAAALAHHDPDGALAYSERTRARGLLESISGSRQPRSMATLDATVIEYAALPSELAIFVSSGGSTRAVQVAVQRSTLEVEAGQLTYRAVSGDPAGFRRASSRLYARLIAPIADMIPHAAPLVFVPDATLRDVAFSALVAPSGRYLVEEHVVTVSPSAAVYGQLAQRRHPPSHNLRLLLVEGASVQQGGLGYLSGLGVEEKAIAGEYGDVVKITPRNGNWDVFRKTAPEADIIHFSGHASANEPGGAALLAPGDFGDERIDVHEIAAVPLTRTRIVVLAACSTADGEERGREGSISLARAFLAAGVSSVVATLWPIDDRAAAIFFPYVHRHLSRGVPAPEALRAAQIECIHSNQVPPFMWAAVQVIGS